MIDFTQPGSMACGYDCHFDRTYGFVPEADCPQHDRKAVGGKMYTPQGLKLWRGWQMKILLVSLSVIAMIKTFYKRSFSQKQA